MYRGEIGKRRQYWVLWYIEKNNFIEWINKENDLTTDGYNSW
jgi:hypothetical protein